MSVMVNGKDEYLVQLPMPYEETGKLTADEALSLARHHAAFAVAVGKYPIVKPQLNYDPHCLRVELQLTTVDEKKKLGKKSTTKTK